MGGFVYGDIFEVFKVGWGMNMVNFNILLVFCMVGWLWWFVDVIVG